LLDSARSQTEQAASRVQDGKKPVKRLSRLSLELANVSHRATSKVVKQQARMLEHSIDAVAGRLHKAANADTVVDLVRGQFRLIPEDASRILRNTRETLSIVAGAGTEAGQLFRGTVAELTGRSTKSKKAKKAAAKPKAGAKTRKAQRKAGTKAAKTPAKAASKAAPATKTRVARKAKPAAGTDAANRRVKAEDMSATAKKTARSQAEAA
jgi:phasin family protein